MAFVHLQMAQMLVSMKGYANMNIISHSWGTTLAYDLQNAGGFEMQHWVTMGSPLKQTTDKPLWNTGNWINCHDFNDFVTGLEMYPPFPSTFGLPSPGSLIGPGLSADPNVDIQRYYNFGFSLTHQWVHKGVSPAQANVK
jgi:hypothetical protein